MASPASRPDPSSDPLRQYLVEVRRGLFRLHKTLIDAERAAFERDRGAQTNGQFLQALIHDPHFEWLRPFTGLIVEMDEMLAPKEPLEEAAVRSFVDQSRELVEPSDAARAAHYERISGLDPEVLLAHLELRQRIQSADEALG